MSAARHQYFRRRDVPCCRRRLRLATPKMLPLIVAALEAEAATKRPRQGVLKALRSTIGRLSIPPC